MATNNQSQFQGLIEGLTSLNSNAQNAQPANPNNGDPATVYNIPAMSNAAGNWWIPPGGSGVNMQAILSQLPQGSPNTNINNILGNLTRPPAGPNPNPGSGPPQIPGVPPGGTPPTGPGVMPGPSGRPPMGPPSVGDISRPVHHEPWNGMGNFNNAQPNTGAGVGRGAALPWAQTSWGSTPLSGQPGGNAVMDALRGLGSQLSGELRGEFNEFIGDITGQNGWQGVLGQLLDGLLPGAGALIDQFFPRDNPTAPMDPAAMQQTNQRLASQLSGLINNIVNSGDQSAQARLEQLLTATRGRMPDGWGEEQMSEADWRRMQRQGAFNNFFTSRGSGSINPITGLPSSDARGDFMNSLSAEAMALFEAMNRNRGDQRR